MVSTPMLACVLRAIRVHIVNRVRLYSAWAQVRSELKPRGGGTTRMSRGYQARLKIHVIRVVFQDQALYALTSFRGAKTCKIGKKGLFLVI